MFIYPKAIFEHNQTLFLRLKNIGGGYCFANSISFQSIFPNQPICLYCMQQRYAAITGVAGYVPDYVLTNHELEKLVDTDNK